MSDDSTRLVTFYEAENGTGAVVTLSLEDGSGVREGSREEGVRLASVLDSFQSWRQKVDLRVLSVDLADLEAKTSPAWVDLISGEAVTDGGRLHGTVVP